MTASTASTKSPWAIWTIVAILVGLGSVSGTYALWGDSENLEFEVQRGVESFAAGPVNHTVEATDGTVDVTVGAPEAAQLVEAGGIAIALQTDSVSQGNRGLSYTISEPDWGDRIFGSAQTALFPIDSAGACAVENAPATASELHSTPISAEHSDSTEPTIEYWCFVAELDSPPVEGTYSSTASVTAESTDDVTVEASDDWEADVTMDPADEPDHAITFSYETFRAEATR